MAVQDGTGDFRGLIEKLDLQDLELTALWLLPFSPSPLRDDGYDTADNTGEMIKLKSRGALSRARCAAAMPPSQPRR
jgi:hypothetical protein